MKNILTTLLLLMSFTAIAQLNSNAQQLKDNGSTEYKLIKKYAESEWGQDYKMIVYTINKQADALSEMITLSKREDYDKELLFAAFQEWSDSSITVGDSVFVDYSMMVYTYKNQLEAKNSY